MTNKAKLAVAMLIIIGIGVRAVLWVNYKPILYHDTPHYTQLATYIQKLNFDGYMGERTPGYVVLFLVSGMNYQVVWLIQLALGLAISLMLFALAWSKTESVTFALLIGLSYTLSINQLFFEASMLTETLGTFLLILSLVLYEAKKPHYLALGSSKKIIIPRKDAKAQSLKLFLASLRLCVRTFWDNLNFGIALGIVMAWAILTRPLMLSVAPLYFLLIADGAVPLVLIFPKPSSIQTHEEGKPTSYTVAITTLRERGIMVIDLGPALVHAKNTAKLTFADYYTQDKLNLNELGNYIVSQTILAQLCQQGILKNCP